MSDLSGADFVKIEVTSPLMVTPVEKPFNRNISLRELKNKLELITGIQADQMIMSLNADDVLHLEHLERRPDASLTSILPPAWNSKLTLVVTGDSSFPGGGDDVPKFVLSDEDYEKRNESLRKFKMQQKLGRFDPEAEEKKRQLEELEVQKASIIKIGDRCQVQVAGHPTRRATVMYVGNTEFKEGVWIGVKYDEPLGKNDGSVGGKKYFDCSPNYGAFIKPTCVEVGDYPPEDDGLMDD